MWALTLWNDDQVALRWSVVIAAVFVAALTDVRSQRIPNWLTGPLFLVGFIAAGLTGGGRGLADAAVASMLLATPYLLLFIFAGGGGGDVKLMAAIGSWLGLVAGSVTLATVAIAGTVMAIAYALARRRGRQVLSNLVGLGLTAACLGVRAGPRFDGESTDPPTSAQTSHMLQMPYGVAIFFGVVLAAMGVHLWSA